jgi:hypothetical protein
MTKHCIANYICQHLSWTMSKKDQSHPFVTQRFFFHIWCLYPPAFLQLTSCLHSARPFPMDGYRVLFLWTTNSQQKVSFNLLLHDEPQPSSKPFVSLCLQITFCLLLPRPQPISSNKEKFCFAIQVRCAGIFAVAKCHSYFTVGKQS